MPLLVQLAYLDYGEDAKVLLNGVTYIVSIQNAKKCAVTNTEAAVIRCLH